MNIRASIFDLDFTLIDASKAIYYCIRHALSLLNYPEPSYQAAISTIGLSFPDTYKALTKDDSEEKIILFRDAFVKYAQDYKEQYLSNTVLFETVIPLLEELKKRGHKLAIVTSKTRDCVDDILQKFQFGHYFEYIIAGNEIEHPKPHPMSLEKAVAELKIEPHEAIYIGDSIVDAEAANRANITFVAVLTGQTQRDAFKPYKCHAIIENLTQFTQQIDVTKRKTSGEIKEENVASFFHHAANNPNMSVQKQEVEVAATTTVTATVVTKSLLN